MVVDEDPAQTGRRERPKIGSSDPRAVRTRSKLIVAFHAAIADSDPAAMSVSSLTQAAGVNRTSFYSHFSSPEDLAIHALSELFDVVANADIAMRGEHSVSAAEASRRALQDIVSFVAAPTVVSLERMDNRPAGADPRVTARFLAGGVLGVIGAWLADPRSQWSPNELVEALMECLPGWLNTD
jgi:AcrR family transcriptional regulator